MRSTEQSLREVTKLLSEAAPDRRNDQLTSLCEIEIGLFLQQHLCPGAPAADTWALFSGFPFAAVWGAANAAEQKTLRTARYTMWTWGRRRAWADALQNYQQYDRLLRGYDVVDPDLAATRRTSLSVAPDRWETYERLLQEAPYFAGRPVAIAGAGRYAFPVGRHLTTIELPDQAMPAPPRHDLTARPANEGRPLTFTRDELLETAAFMDSIAFAKWVERLEGTHFFRQRKGAFHPAEEFEVARLQHLLGIVGAGKSTLRDVIAVHLARRRHRTTVIIGDVAEQLKLVDLYNTFVPGSAAPVLGASSRPQHAERLHRRLANRGGLNLLVQDDPSFAYLSTSCALDALRLDDMPLGYGEAPCQRLQPPDKRGGFTEGPWKRPRQACPFWTGCPRHHAARELVDALIWVATPASLVDVAVPYPQNHERVRYLELACRRSDLVIVDEADRVQMQLDRMFAPAIPLIGGGPDTRSFLDDVNQHRIRELASAGRIQLSDRDVENWSAAVNTTQAAADRLLAMLVSDVGLRNWVRIGYFSAWTLQLRLIEERYPVPDDHDHTAQQAMAGESAHLQARRQLTEVLDAFRDNPFGDRRLQTEESAELTSLLSELLHTNNRARTRSRLVETLRRLFDLDPILRQTEQGYERYEQLRTLAGDGPSPEPKCAKPASETDRRRWRRALPAEPDEWLKLLATRFEFTLLLSAMEPKLALINAMWPRVAVALKLGFNEMYRRPLDYGPMVPEAPMGNVIGFQFIMQGPDPGGVRSGELRFFRCSGVGRELLRAMPGLPEVDGRPGTNVLLMSGSSWAGRSSRYHINVPIGVIIEPDPKELDHIADQSRFRIEFLRDGCRCGIRCQCDELHQPYRISGEPLTRRGDILRRMAVALGRNDEGISKLQSELLKLPESRRHILLLVGSYEEAKIVADALHTLNARWRGRVRRLVPDDEIETGSHLDDDEHHAPVLRRGEVETLASTRAEILVAPLLAVERGHNILDVDRQHAAIGSIYFLARPNPRPDDLGLAVHAINDWIVRAVESGEFASWVRGEATLGQGAREVRHQARSQWYRVLARSMAWSRLDEDRESVTWDLLVLIWQVIGRSVRGAVPTRVAFVDAAFAPNLALGQSDTPETSLLHSIHAVLRPYFTSDGDVPEIDRRIVMALYRPMWQALDQCLTQITKEGVSPCIT